MDDPIFRRTTNAQWLWYAAQVSADEREEFELLRDVAEHNAMFWNPQGVEQVRGAREKTFSISDQDFGSIIEQTFGRKIQLPDKPKEGIMHSVPIEPRAKSEAPATKRSIPSSDNALFVEEDLDTIDFMPFQEEPAHGRRRHR